MLVFAFMLGPMVSINSVKAEEPTTEVEETQVVEEQIPLTPQGLIEKMGALKQSITTIEDELGKLNEAEVVIQNQIDITNLSKTELENSLVNLKKTVEANTERIDTIKALTEKETYQVSKKATKDGLSNKPLAADINSTNAKEKNVNEDVKLATEKGELQKSLKEDTLKIEAQTIELKDVDVELSEQEKNYDEFLAGKTVVEDQLRDTKIGYEQSRDSLISYNGDLQAAVNDLVYTGSGQFFWPVEGFNAISSEYGDRWGTVHRGVDIGTHSSNPVVYAAEDGIVVAAEDNGDGFGNKVIINHGSQLVTLYGHLDSIETAVGRYVFKGEPIGRAGNTGNSFGNHLHFQVSATNQIYTDTLDPIGIYL